MIYQLTHTTTYDYAEPVSLSHHLLRLRPRELAYQNCLNHSFAIDPAPQRLEIFSDYYGNHVAAITIQEPHDRLVVRSSSQVQRNYTRCPDPLESPAWEQVRDLIRGVQIGSALDASEYLFDSHLVAAGDEFAHYASASFSKSRPILDAVLHLTERIHEDFTFDPEATTVTTTVSSVLKSRRGVCQDFAHLQIACLRSLGIPARYVSGYIETLPPPGKAKILGSDASHAWVSIYCHALGWIEVDPTNNLLASNQHITIGWGRDYSDIAPIRGVILGSGHHTLKVAVDLKPMLAESGGDPAPAIENK